MKRLIIVYVAILISLTLSFHIHSPIVPAPSKLVKKTKTIKTVQPNSTEYLLFMDELNKITNVAGFVLRTLQLGFGKQFADLIVNFKKYNTGLEAIRKVLKKFRIYINQKQKICPKPQSFNKSQIYRYINFTQQKQAAILKQMQGNSQFDKMKDDLKKMKQLSDSYLSYVKKTIQGSFCNLPQPEKPNNGSVSPKKEKLYYKNNLQVSNWFYGSTNQLKYKAYLLKKAANFNLSTCPTELPFVRDDEQKCFNCPPGSIYNLGAQKCDSCPHGKMLNVATGHCEPCFGQMFIINHQFVCKACALESSQLFDPKTGKCYKCKENEYLDATARACKSIKCPPDQPRFNRELEICQKCKPNQVISPTNPTVCIPNCPKEKPLYNNQTKSGQTTQQNLQNSGTAETSSQSNIQSQNPKSESSPTVTLTKNTPASNKAENSLPKTQSENYSSHFYKQNKTIGKPTLPGVKVAGKTQTAKPSKPKNEMKKQAIQSTGIKANQKRAEPKANKM